VIRVPRKPFIAVLCLLAPAPGLLTAQQLMTAEHVAGLRTVISARISPDGQRVAYVLNVPRKPFGEEKDGPAWTELHRTGTGGRSLPFVSGEVNVGSIAWTPDGQSISFLAKRGDDKERSLYVIPIAGGEARRVLTHETAIQSYSWKPDGKQIAFTASEPEPSKDKNLKDKGFSQEIYEEKTRRVKVWVAEIAAPKSEDWTAGTETKKEEKPRELGLAGSASDLHWSPRGDLVAITLAPTPSVDDSYMNQSIHFVDPSNGEAKGRYQPPGKMGAYAWSPDGKHLAVISSADRNDPAAGRLVVVPVTSGNGRDVLPRLEGHVTDVSWKDGETVLYVAAVGTSSIFGEIGHEGQRSRVFIPAAEGRLLNTVEKARDDSAMTFLSDSASHPAEVFHLGAAGAAPKRLTNSNPWLSDLRFARQEVVSYTARDGLKLEGILVRPLDEQAGRRYPLIVAVHGGPEAHVANGWVTSYANPGQVAAARDMAVFYPNYRGSTGRGVAFSKLDHGDPAGKEFDDIVDAVDHLAATGLVDKDKVGITGGSYGGYASAWGATYYTERFAASVMFVGISDTISKIGTTDIPEEMYLVHHRHRLWENWDLFLKRSPIYYVEKARTPTLILGGKDDTRVHPSQSLELYRLLKLVGKAPVRLVQYPGEGHGNRRAASRYDYNLRMIRWMEHYLKGPGGEPPPVDINYPLEPKKESEEKK